MTLEPDGQATGCNPVEAGSIPAGVYDGQLFSPANLSQMKDQSLQYLQVTRRNEFGTFTVILATLDWDLFEKHTPQLTRMQSQST